MPNQPDDQQPIPDVSFGSSRVDPEPSRKRKPRKRRRFDEAPTPSSPASTGPAGALLEGHVGAQYLLPLLTRGEARGMPGALVTRVAFQRAGFGHPMDDIVISGVDSQGQLATLEVQAKRTITFTENDSVFADVVVMACRTAAKPEFATSRHELAIAISRSSTKIEQRIQVVLKWARDYQDPTAFFARLNQQGCGHQDMRDFVAAFRSNMQAAGAAHDDGDVWHLLSRFQVLAFDFEQPGSLCEAWARDRCAAALSSKTTTRASELWDTLQHIALDIDAVGGDLDRQALLNRLTRERGYQLAGDRKLHAARERLAEAANHALASIKSHVHGVHVDRSEKISTALAALEHGRYLEILGAGGVGKSAVLKEIAQQVSLESRVLVLSPHRVPAGGLTALIAELGGDASPRELLTDLAGDGGGFIFVDGIDRFDDDGQRNTVADILREASQVPGFRVVVTARADFDSDARAWLPAMAVQALGPAPALLIDELSTAEVERLRQADSALAALLRAGHPAEKVVRNLYRLDRLSQSAGTNVSALTEAQMAKQWWDTGDGAAPSTRIARQRVLHTLAVHLISSSAPMDMSQQPCDAITGLIESEALQQVTAVRVQLKHDVLGDWAIGCLLFEEPELIISLPLSNPAPTRLARGMEIAAQMNSEIGRNSTGWRALLASVDGAHGSWRRAVLLAPTRSERSSELLSWCLSDLETRDAPLLSEIVRTAIVIDSQSAARIWAKLGIDTSNFTDDFALPRGPAWINLITWSLANTGRLPSETIPQWVDLYGHWCNGFLGQDAYSPILIKTLHKWLIAAEATSQPRSVKFKPSDTTDSILKLSLSDQQLRELRRTFLTWSKLCPEETVSYFKSIAVHPNRRRIFQELVHFMGTAPVAAPEALADLILQVLTEGDPNENHRSYRDLFSHWDLEYMPASPARPPFLDLLQAEREQGLRLIRGLVAYAVKERSGGRVPGADQIEIPFPGKLRAFPWKQSYRMPRSDRSYIVRSALMALEAWTHLRIEQGEAIEAVIQDVLGPEGSPAAYLLVAVDVLLSHWPQSRLCIWPFAASATLLAVDHMRFAHESLGMLPKTRLHPEPPASVILDDLLRRPSRRLPLSSVLRCFAVEESTQIREPARRALEVELAKLGPPNNDDATLSDPSVMAVHALNGLNPENYAMRTNSAGTEELQYVSPPGEAAYFARLQQQSEQGETQFFLVSRLTRAISEDKCQASILEQAVAWTTHEAAEHETPEDDFERDMISRAKLIVAALVLRDGSPEMQSTHSAWATQKLSAEASCDTDHHGPKQLPYNRAAIALIGLLAAHRHDPKNSELKPILQLAAMQASDIVGVIRAELKAKRLMDADLTRALIRLGLSSAIYAVRQRDDEWDRVDDYQTYYETQEAIRKNANSLRRQSAVEAESRWLMGQGLEPAWPELPAPGEPRLSRGLSIRASHLPETTLPPPQRFFAFDSSTGAGVMTLALDLWRVDSPELLENFVHHASTWTAAANGAGLGSDYESGERVYEWNRSYFPAALAVAISNGNAGIEKYATEYLLQLPEKEFLVAAEATLFALDHFWLEDHTISDDDALALRKTVAQRVRTTWYWRRLTTERSSSIALDAADAVASLFMCKYLIGNFNCYVLPPGMTRVDRCLPMLTELAEEAAGSTFVALAILNLLEVDPRLSRLVPLSRLVSAWWASHGASTDFWIDYGMAKRICEWVGKAVLNESTSIDELHTTELISILDILLQSGTPLARSLEERIIAQRISAE